MVWLSVMEYWISTSGLYNFLPRMSKIIKGLLSKRMPVCFISGNTRILYIPVFLRGHFTFYRREWWRRQESVYRPRGERLHFSIPGRQVYFI
jgi:hypothetical protein